jgi:lysophospholipase L1-like esterase
MIFLVFLAVVSFHYQVPQKVFARLGFAGTYKPVITARQSARNALFYEYSQRRYRIVMLGDSITEWVSWNELLGMDDIANRGIAGDTTEWLYKRLPTVYTVNPEICSIMGGINDILRGIPLETIQENMEAIIEGLNNNGIKPLICSTLYVSKERQNWKAVNKNVEKLNDGLKNLCYKKGIVFLDVNSELSDADAIEDRYVFDGLHLNGAGYAKWGEMLAETIRNM